SLINRLHESGEPLVIVIDDWHRISAAEPIAALEFLLDNGCHHLRIVVASRKRSDLPLSRMRVLDEVSEIDSAALSFDAFETRSFFTGRVDIPLTESDIEDLVGSTDGWVAALQLASLSLREHPPMAADGQSEGPGAAATLLKGFRGGIDELGDYLADNVLNALEPEMLDFILCTAVPERVCGSLASELAGVPDGLARLEQVVARELFLARTGDGDDLGWHRYHHLFAQILRQRLNRDYPGRMTQLHRTASAWFRKQHLLGEAIDHLISAGEPSSAVALMENDDLYLLDRSLMSTLLGLIEKLPAEMVLASPRLQLTIGWANTELQRLSHAIEARRRALELLDILDLTAENRDQLRVEADVLQADIDVTADRVGTVKDLVAECLAQAPSHHPFVVSMAALLDTFADARECRFEEAYRRQTWAAPYHSRTTGPYTVAYGYCFAGLAKAEQLDVQGAIDLYRRALTLVRTTGNTQAQHARITRTLLAEMLYLQDQVGEAKELLGETYDVVAIGGAPDFIIRHYYLNARIQFDEGNINAAAMYLDEGARTAETFSLARLRAAVDNERARLGMAPRPEFVAAVRGARNKPADGLEQITAQLEDETAVLLLLRSGETEKINRACDWAEEWARTLDGTGRRLAWLHAERLLVSCLWAAGRVAEAESVLISVASICARQRLVRFLVDGGTDVIHCLSSLRERLHEAGPQAYPDLPRSFVDSVLAAAASRPKIVT
ncbi:serine/threonine-protein kinase, partial [Rhodococcus koreensis]